MLAFTSLLLIPPDLHGNLEAGPERLSFPLGSPCAVFLLPWDSQCLISVSPPVRVGFFCTSYIDGGQLLRLVSQSMTAQ